MTWKHHKDGSDDELVLTNVWTIVLVPDDSEEPYPGAPPNDYENAGWWFIETPTGVRLPAFSTRRKAEAAVAELLRAPFRKTNNGHTVSPHIHKQTAEQFVKDAESLREDPRCKAEGLVFDLEWEGDWWKCKRMRGGMAPLPPEGVTNTRW